MVPVRLRTPGLLIAAAAAVFAAAGPLRAQENPTTPGAIPNPGSYQGSLELQRREQEQSQQYQQPQRQPDYGTPQRGGGYGGQRGGMAPGADVAAYQRGDYVTAYRLTLPNAQRGDRVAQYNMGTLYAKGLGVRKDPVQAAVWFQRAAAQGEAGAANDLAMAYAFGQGVPRDYVQSYIWLTRAAGFARSGADRNAILVNRKELVGQMTPAQLAQARQLTAPGGGKVARR